MAKRIVSAAQPDATSIEQVAYRLKVTRKVLGWSQTYIAGQIGLATASAWNNYEQGVRYVSIQVALRLCVACGVSTDWVYRGRLGEVDHHLAVKIQAQLDADREDYMRRDRDNNDGPPGTGRAARKRRNKSA